MAKINLKQYGITGTTEVIYNPSYDELYREETRKGLRGYEKGQVTEMGAVNVMTGVYTGRSPKDKFFVMDETTKDTIWWTSPEYKNDNKPVTKKTWKELKKIAVEELSNKKLFVVDTFCGANENTRLKIRFIMEVAWQAHFVKNMFIRPTDEELEKEIADMGWNGEDYAVMQRMSHTCYSFSLQSIVQTIMRKVMEFLFRAASLVVDTIRTFFLIVLSVLGPIAFAISVFDGFQGTLVQWLARYISVYLWLPISDLLGVMLAKIQTLVLQSEMEMIQDPLSVFSPDGSTAIYLVFMLIGLVGYFCVPTVANWVVQAGGMGAYNRNMNNTASKAANVGGAVAGASTGNVAGVLLKK